VFKVERVSENWIIGIKGGIYREKKEITNWSFDLKSELS
jgi:hypothetical protein